MPTVYLVTGGSRGIGFGLVQALASAPDTIVFAGARNPSSKDLSTLATAHPDKVIPIALESADIQLNKAAAKSIEEKAGKLDVVIAVAGIGNAISMSEIEIPEFLETFKVNTVGPLVLFQSVRHLLKKTFGKFVAVSSSHGSIAEMLPGPAGAYCVTKAALNSLTVKLREENPDLVIFPIDPGFVATEGALKFATDLGTPPEILKLAAPIDKAAADILKHVHEAVKVEKPRGFWNAMGPREIAF
ncbi:hypothetical protein IAR55_006363 [Kwoniella newhampshirensis]|uniref:Cytoplasmic protein n=1 Tax=Kwoniella newhampshirensis TaxID=1651941 RepID=A0AAW0YR26_9TREE